MQFLLQPHLEKRLIGDVASVGRGLDRVEEVLRRRKEMVLVVGFRLASTTRSTFVQSR